VPLPYSYRTYTGNGVLTGFAVPFPYVAREHVHVYLGWDPSTFTFASELVNEVGFTWATGTSITTTAPVADGTTISVVRITPIEQQLSEWQAGSPPTAYELTTADRQILYAVQEYIDRTLQVRDDLDDAVLVGAGVTLIDNLSSVLTNAGLTANQGRVLKELYEAQALLVGDAQASADSKVAKAGDTMTGDLTVPSLNGGQLAGLRNLIINGNMLVYQRGGSFNLAANTGAYTLDRWLCTSIGGGANIQQVIVDRAARLRFTGGAGSTTSNVNQRIESWDIAHLAGQQVTLSFDVSNTLRTNLVVNLTYPNVADNYTTFTAGPVANVTVNSTLTRYSVTFTLGAQAINGLQVTFTFANQTSGSFDLARVQLEAGPLATPFETLPLPVENTLCKRFFHFVSLNIWGIATGAFQITEVGIPFPTRMRTVPFIGALQADPETGATSLNNNAQSISRITSQWAAPYVQSAAAGQFYILGYRYPLDAEL
jgi:hypothetical protein